MESLATLMVFSGRLDKLIVEWKPHLAVKWSQCLILKGSNHYNHSIIILPMNCYVRAVSFGIAHLIIAVSAGIPRDV